MNKVCNCCNIEKPISSFYKRKDSNDGYRNNCKECQNINNKENFNKWYDKQSTKDKIKENNKNNWEKNKELLKIKNKERYYKNREKNLVKKKEYYLNNRDVIISKNLKYRKNRLKYDTSFKVKENIRCLIRRTFIIKGIKKNTKTEQILGCSFVEFKLHLESKFEKWMSWENYGKYNGELNHGWDIDHIIPISIAKTIEEIYELNNYKNLQPLCSKINRDVKKDNN